MNSTIYFILPTYNESQSIFDLLKEINLIQAKLKNKIICLVVNDASSDDTNIWIKKSIDEFKKIKITEIKHTVNLGLNNALNSGFNELPKKFFAKDIVVTMDGDNTHDPRLIYKMIDKHKLGFDLVIASRYLKTSKVKGVSAFRIFLSHGAKSLYKLFWRFKGINEYTCLYRSCSADLIIRFVEKYKYPYLQQKGFACTTELLSKLISLNPKISEIPIILDYTKKVSESKMKLFSTIFTTLKILFVRISR